MEQPCRLTKKCIYDNASQWSRWTFLWMLPVFQTGWKKDLDLSDLPMCCESDEPEFVTKNLENVWNQELKNCREKGKEPSLSRVIIKSFWKKYLLANTVIIFG